MTLEEFYHQARLRQEETKERYGQALFNLLTVVRPFMAEEIRSTDKDPFYTDDKRGKERLEAFHLFLAENWFEDAGELA